MCYHISKTRATLLRKTGDHITALDDYHEALWLIWKRIEWLDEHGEDADEISIPVGKLRINKALMEIYQGQTESYSNVGRI